MSSVLNLRTVNQQFQVGADGTTGSVPTILRDATLQPTVEEIQIIEVNLAPGLTDEVIDLTSVEKPLALYFDCDQDIDVKLGDGTSEITLTKTRSGALNFGTAEVKTLTLKVTTPSEFPIPSGQTTPPASATLYVLLAGNRS